MESVISSNFSFFPPQTDPISILERISSKELIIIQNLFEKNQPIKILILSKNVCPSLSSSGNVLIINLQGQIIGLNLSRKQMETLPEEIITFSELKFLDLSHNRLSNLPDNFARLTKLQYLDLSYNNLPEIPSTINFLPELQNLMINNNPLITLPWPHFFIIRNIHPSQEALKGGKVPFLNFTLISSSELYVNDFHAVISRYFPLQNDSNDIWSHIIENIVQTDSDQVLSLQILTLLMKELYFRYEQGFSRIVEKILKNIPLDPLDLTHPRLGEWYRALEKVCLQYSTSVGAQFLQFLRNKFFIQMENFPILL